MLENTNLKEVVTMFKILGIIMIIGSTTSFGLYKKNQYVQRVKSINQAILMIKIMQRELTFNCPKTIELVKFLSNELTYPLRDILRRIYKLAKIDDSLSIEYKWTKIFRDYGDIAHFKPEDTEILVNIASVLGKYDINEQINSLEYFRNLLEQNLKIACNQSANEGNITRAVAVSVGMIIAIILI